MAISLYAVTGNAADILGMNFAISPSRKVKVVVSTNLPTDEAVIDLEHNRVLAGRGEVQVATDGSFAIEDLIGFDSEDVNPAGIQYKFDLVYMDAATRKEGTWSTGWVSITADIDLADLVAEQYVPPTYMSGAVATLQELVDQASEITGLTGEDEAVAALVATPSSDTASALADSYEGQFASDAPDPETVIGGTLAAVTEGVLEENFNELFAGATATRQALTMVALPDALDARKGFNSSIYTQNTLTLGEVQYIAYYNSAGKPIIARRPMGEVGAKGWEKFDLSTISGNPLVSPVADDDHNVLAVGVDSDGYLHVAGNMHNNALRYVRQTVLDDLTSFVAGAMSGSNESSVTYPWFLMHEDGTLEYLIRTGVSGQGDYYRNRYDPATHTWTQQSKLLDGNTSSESPYLNTPIVYPNGDVGLFFTWRGSGEAGTTADLCYARIKPDGTAVRADGTAQTVPITHANAEKIIDTGPIYSGLLNQQGAAIDTQGRVHAMQTLADVQGNIQAVHAYYDAGWHVEIVTDAYATWNFAGSNGTAQMARGVVACDKAGRTWFIHHVRTDGYSNVLRATEVTPGAPTRSIPLVSHRGAFLCEPSVQDYAMRHDGLLIMAITNPTGSQSTPAGVGGILSVDMSQLPLVEPVRLTSVADDTVRAATVTSAASAAFSDSPLVLIETGQKQTLTMVRATGVAHLSGAGTGTIDLVTTPLGGSDTIRVSKTITSTTGETFDTGWVHVGTIDSGYLKLKGSSTGSTTMTLDVARVEVSQATSNGAPIPYPPNADVRTHFFADNFDTAGNLSGAIGSDGNASFAWQILNVTGTGTAISKSGSKVAPTAGTGVGGALMSPGRDSNRFRAVIDAASAGGVILAARYSSGYRLQLTATAMAGSYTVAKVIAGTATTLLTVPTLVVTAGDIMELKTVGTVGTAYVNGVQVWTGDVPDVPVPADGLGRGGVLFFYSGGAGAVSEFSCDPA